MYEAAVKLIKKTQAYVCDLTADQIREYRGTLKEPGKNSPYRDRSDKENLQLFEDMKKRQVSGWIQGIKSEDRYVFTEYQHA